MNELEEVAGKRENWTSMLGTPTRNRGNNKKNPQNPQKNDGWMDKVMEEN